MDVSPVSVAVRQLVGVWKGTGSGEFPTIDSFTYRERLEVSELRAGRLHYLQQTWRHVDGEEVGSHMETGFIIVTDDAAVEILNAQSSGRVEVLRGSVSLQEGTVVVDLHSVTLAHDERMIGSRRELRLDEDELAYSMAMATTSVPEVATHLTAHLTRR